MKIDISDFYKQKGFSVAYVTTNKEQRRIVTLRKPNGEATTTSYAKYLYTSFHKCDVDSNDNVDHINGDKTDDRIENLQVISKDYNIKKDHKVKEMVLLRCPVCGEEFVFPKKDLSTHKNPCCSMKCGNKKKSQTLLERNETIGYKHKCVLCGKPFRAVSGKKYCSDECREKAKNKLS